MCKMLSDVNMRSQPESRYQSPPHLMMRTFPEKVPSVWNNDVLASSCLRLGIMIEVVTEEMHGSKTARFRLTFAQMEQVDAGALGLSHPETP